MKTTNGTAAQKIAQQKELELLKPEISIEQKQLYNMFKENMTPLEFDAEGKWLVAQGRVPLSLCFVDMRYQGYRAHKQIAKLEHKWDVRKLTPIVLVDHPEEFRFAVVDGQGRTIVAPKKGLNSLNAIVLMQAPVEAEERLRFEADYFRYQNDGTESMKPVESHLANVICGDEAALALNQAFNKYGLSFVEERGQRSESVVGSYSDFYRMSKSYGEKCLDFILSIIENAGWNHETNGYSRAVTSSLKNIWVAHPDDRKEIHTFLSDVLRQMDPGLFGAKARATYPQREQLTAAILYTEDVVCNGLKIQRRIYSDGSRCKIVK